MDQGNQEAGAVPSGPSLHCSDGATLPDRTQIPGRPPPFVRDKGVFTYRRQDVPVRVSRSEHKAPRSAFQMDPPFVDAALGAWWSTFLPPTVTY